MRQLNHTTGVRVVKHDRFGMDVSINGEVIVGKEGNAAF